jgi:hypothetical protein
VGRFFSSQDLFDRSVYERVTGMKLATARTSTAIKVLSTLIVVLTVGFMIASFIRLEFLAVGLILTVVTLGCWLRTPVGYEVRYGRLIVVFRVGERDFGRIQSCAPVNKRQDLTIRLWGNGGLFAGTGIFWNQTWGIFRAYVTTSSLSNLVLVQTQAYKVLISPEDRSVFLSDAGPAAAAGSATFDYKA